MLGVCTLCVDLVIDKRGWASRAARSVSANVLPKTYDTVCMFGSQSAYGQGNKLAIHKKPHVIETKKHCFRQTPMASVLPSSTPAPTCLLVLQVPTPAPRSSARETQKLVHNTPLPTCPQTCPPPLRIEHRKVAESFLISVSTGDSNSKQVARRHPFVYPLVLTGGMRSSLAIGRLAVAKEAVAQ
ncbi:hypothetical protein CYLTODRAFT_246972 [Cylindrobasidium torrendii FP15055 ss-10]|uniref:Uncharacterized protein n=1 Tax=Cylindrobasidium torrendii FP15055 ss-10 TaxID=1314674 RepID=A0A0D7BEP1_9AGAR|nr:hypothetical protein CYLTODRAFT_246972 [Cylindrobasidium torrendii FP15055 ss-10]